MVVIQAADANLVSPPPIWPSVQHKSGPSRNPIYCARPVTPRVYDQPKGRIYDNPTVERGGWLADTLEFPIQENNSRSVR